MTIEFLYFEDCPSHELALERLKKVIAEAAPDAEVRIMRVETEHQAQELRFPGSPTIRVDGHDIDPDFREQQIIGLTCRVYRKADGSFTPLPPEEMIRRALRAGT